MTRQADNERTMLMSRWFRCVKLPPAVSEPEHPFHTLFAGDVPSHLFVSRPDGSGRVDLRGDQSRTELWKAMESLLAASYAEKISAPLKTLSRLLDRLDTIDQRLGDVREQLDAAIEKKGPSSPRVAKLRRELEDLVRERDDLRGEASRVSRIEPLQPPPAEGEAGSPADSGTEDRG